MPLPDSYLEYPHRSHGMDQDRYGWDPADRRAPITLKSGIKTHANILIPLEFFPLDPAAKPFKHPGAMQTPYPDLRHFTTRDYGNRVGVYRLLEALAEANVKATFAINAEIAKRYPPLLTAIKEAGHEIAAHGVSTSHIHYEDLSEDEERAYINTVRETFPDAVTWMSPARNESTRTLDLIKEAGFDICLDWEADTRPLMMHTQHGDICALPNYNELSDFKLLLDRSQSEREWIKQIKDAAEYQVSLFEKEGASSFAFTLTPYILGQPFRIHAVCEMLKSLQNIDGLAFSTASETALDFSEGTS
ncbi:polysaccharide deacetylase family protein [Hirschia litorea]|uniref:Chitooligosaccharide deacetylase n=1 Tax=Hirschia litorea TaxID=1199156 RepID=A0ABW2IH55_9PROT